MESISKSVSECRQRVYIIHVYEILESNIYLIRAVQTTFFKLMLSILTKNLK